jgi:ABC-type Mn2+/Zn2+ transport system permease subunit
MNAYLGLTPDAWWTIAVASCCNVACALLGCYLVLRRMSLLGDAISHAILPGIVLAFLFTGERQGWAILLGAMALGVLTTFLTQGLHGLGKVPEDASMGVVFTALFAAGVILITRYASQVDLDPGCVLYGVLENVTLQTIEGTDIPEAFLTQGPAVALTVAFILLFWKELKIVSFDPALAKAMGLPVALVHYALMAMVAGVTVASFEAVGSILVIAMLIVPGATAHLLTDRLPWMLVWSAVVALLCAFFGYLGAVWLNTSTAGMMSVVAGLQFLLAVVFAPRHGLLSKAWRNYRLSVRIACEDTLAALFRREENVQAPAPIPGGLRGMLAQALLRRFGLLTKAGQRLKLTERGRKEASFLVRSHRLWESFVGQHFQLPLDHLHDPAERMEHFIGPTFQEELATELQQPATDPHGKMIPPA